MIMLSSSKIFVKQQKSFCIYSQEIIMLTIASQTIFYCLLTFEATTNIILVNISYGGKMGLIS